MLKVSFLSSFSVARTRLAFDSEARPVPTMAQKRMTRYKKLATCHV